MVTKYDRVLIVGDFNIHVCCPSMSCFTADVINLYDSFNLMVNNPSHNKVHILDHVLSCGVSLNNIHLLEFSLSDHKVIIFHTQLHFLPISLLLVFAHGPLT